MTRRYSSVSTETTLASSISNSATTMIVATGTASAFLGGVSLTAGNVDQFTIAIDPDTVNEEIVFVTGVSSDTLTIVRGRAGTSAITHAGGATVKHVLTSDDLTYFTSGVDSAVTLTGTQTLTNKTLTAPTISTIVNTGTITLPTSTDTLVGKATTDTLTNKTLTSPAISGAVLTGTVTAGGGVGTNGQVLSSTATGVQWSTPSTGYTQPTLGTTAIPSATTVSTIEGLTLTSPTVNDPKLNLSINANTATTYTFVLTDNGKLVTSNNASAQTLSIPTNASVAFPVGTQINVAWITGAGQPTIQAVTSGTTTVLSTGATSTAPKLRVANSVATCIKLATDIWLVTGDIA